MKKLIFFVLILSIAFTMPTVTNSAKVSNTWTFCFKDNNYIEEYHVNIEGRIIRGQAITDHPAFPAPITGYIYGRYALFSIAYLGDHGLRFYAVEVATGRAMTWGIADATSDFYDIPHSAQISPCALASYGSEIGYGAATANPPEIINSWDYCVKDMDFTPFYWFNNEGGVIRGQAILPPNQDPAFPAPLTGCQIGKKVFFAIGYREDSGLRFYGVTIATGMAETWGVMDATSEYYDPPHGTLIEPCDLATSGKEKGTGVAGN